MGVASFFQKQLDNIAKASCNNMGNVLIFTFVSGWLASSMAQLIAIATNKNYTKKQKRYMLAQESADAAIGIGSYFVITKSIKDLTSKMVSTGKLAPKSVIKFLKERNLSSMRGDYNFDITKVNDFKEIRQNYNKFKCFADSTAAIGGGVISSNVITPVLRNRYATHRHNTYISENSIRKQGISTQRHSFDDFKMTSLQV